MTAFAFLQGRGARLSAAACLVALAVGACGRRGPLEPPPDVSVPAPAAAPARPVAADPRLRPRPARVGQAAPPVTTLSTRPGELVEDTPEDDETEEETLQSAIPSPTPTSRKRSRAFTVPNQPFILDPLL